MRIIDLAIKDLSQILRDKRSLFFLVLMPVIFTLFFGFMFSNEDGQQDPRQPVGVLNQDPDGMISQQLVEMLSTSDTVRMVALAVGDEASLDQKVQQGELAAAILIPEGYSTAVLDGDLPRLQVIVDDFSEGGQTARHAIQTVVTRLFGGIHMANFSADSVEAQAGFADEAARQQYLESYLVLNAEAWKDSNAAVRLTGPVIEQNETNESGSASPYAQSSPGMMVQFGVFGLVQSAMVLVLERRSGALQRLMTTPIRKAEMIGGHILAMFVVVFAQQVILAAFGQFALGLDYLREPLAILLVIIALSLWAASLGLLIGALAKTEEHVILLSLISMFVFAALGGCWFSLEYVGETFSAVGHLMPTAWAMDGFQNIVLRGLGLSSVLLPVGILLAYAAAFFGLALWRFKFE